MVRVSEIRISVKRKCDLNVLRKKAAKILGVNENDILNVKIARKSIDARKKSDVFYTFSINVYLKSGVNEEKLLKRKNVSDVKEFKYFFKKCYMKKRPVVVGFGPAGFMAALVLARSGVFPIIIEQGKCVDDRIKDVEAFRNRAILNPMSNIQFGEGGAGTFSDGKLTTGIKDFRSRIVIKELVKAGAPEEILYCAKPHIGTDNLVKIVKNIRSEIIALGGEIFFETEMLDFEEENGALKSIVCENADGVFKINTDRLILAIGHSSRKTFDMLYKKNVNIEQKSFSVGVRIEHSQEFINKVQYGDFSKYLPPADYKLFTHLKNGRGVYTFCMCPGGIVVGAASEKGGIVTNGMSFYGRGEKNANSAVLVGITPDDFKSRHPLAGVDFQREIEKRAFICGGRNYSAPVQTVGDFLADRATVISKNKFKGVFPSYLPKVSGGDFKNIFNDEICFSLREGIKVFDKKIRGFADENAVMTAPETRSSSPVRILRNEKYMSSIEGILPCGEGCGYAGGIVSSAVDGIKCAQVILEYGDGDL